MTRATSWFGSLARRFARGLARLHYSRIEVEGADRIPTAGPVLFVANHANSLLDPVIIGITAKRPVHFLAKAPLFQIPVFGRLLFAFGMVPAFRGADDSSQVNRNLESLSRAAKFLAEGDAVGIFPEGKSHDALQLEQVKGGAARMALQAIEAGAADVTIVPLGINYERKERFRSAVWVQVGKPIQLREWLAANPGEDRQKTRQLTREIDARLREVVVHLADPAWEPILRLLEVFRPPGRFTPVARVRQRKRISDAMNHFWSTDRARAEAMMGRLQSYQQHVKEAGVTPQSSALQTRGWKLAWRLTWEALFMDIGFLLVLVGTLHHLIPFFIVRGIACLFQAGKSTIALSRLAIGLPIYALWYALVWRWIAGYFLPWVAWAWLIPMPVAGLLALKYWWRVRDTSGLWWRQVWMVLFRREQLATLRQEHVAISDGLRAMAGEFATARRLPEEQPLSWRRAAKQNLKVAAAAVVLLVALIWGAWLLKPNPIPELMRAAPDLRALPSHTLAAWLAEDERVLEENIVGLLDLEARTARIKSDFESGTRSFYSQKDDDEIRQLLLKYLSHRTTLLNLIWKYQKHAQVRDDRPALRAFLLCFGSACAIHDASVKLITYFDDAPNAIRKLNEPEPLWNIPPGVYDMVKANILQRQTREFMAAWMEKYQGAQRQFDEHGLRNAPYDRIHATVRRHAESAPAVSRILIKAGVSDPLVGASALGKGLAYKGQAFISTWLGSTRVRVPRSGARMISEKQLAEMRQQLKPGDILIERQNWYLSRAFMPGFWAHAALYVGTTNDLAKLGLADDPRVQSHWREFVRRDAEGHEHVILEAVPQGVRMTTLEHCIGIADSAAVLRPRVGQAQIREAIARAFSHLGKPYDFDFDFFSTDKLVCTELVYRAYDGQVQFPLAEVMGRKTLPPTELVRKFVAERNTGGAQLDCVCFLDGDETSGKAMFRDVEVFAETINRPGLTWFQPSPRD